MKCSLARGHKACLLMLLPLANVYALSVPQCGVFAAPAIMDRCRRPLKLLARRETSKNIMSSSRSCITMSNLPLCASSSSSSDGDPYTQNTEENNAIKSNARLKTAESAISLPNTTENKDSIGDFVPLHILDDANDESVSSYARLISSLPRLKPRRIHPSDDIANATSTAPLSDSKGKIHILDKLDRKILYTAVPSMINLAVVPLVNSVDTFWVGRMGSALALAGQAAANQAFFTLYFLASFLPTITAPRVATEVGRGNRDEARKRVCESLFVSAVFGGLATILLVSFPKWGLRLVLQRDAPALQTAAPYLRLRALSMIPALFGATGFAAYRGLLNTVTPLRVSLFTNALNLVADPIFIFGLPARVFGKAVSTLWTGMGVAGAALATALAEGISGLIYLKLLRRRDLIRWSQLVKPPSWANLLPLLRGGSAMLARQATLNVAFLTAARRAQAMDPTGVSAAAYGIVMQIYSVGIVVHLAIQGTAAALVPSAQSMGGKGAARAVADRIFIWGSITGLLLGVAQMTALPFLVPLFSTLPEVQEAVKAPALISAFIHFINGPVFAGEGTMLGLSNYGALATVTAMGVGTMVACLASPLGRRLDGILLSLAAFCLFQSVAVVVYHLRFGPLRRRSWQFNSTESIAAAV